MSAGTNLADELFASRTKDEIRNGDFMWQPIPAHILQKKSDMILHGDRPCPKYEALYEYHTTKSPIVRRIYKKYSRLFPYWAEMRETIITSIENVFNIYEKYYTDKEQQRP